MNFKEFKTVFADFLLPLGYSNVKNMFYRRIGEVFTIVDLQKSDFAGSYYVNLGLFVDEEADLTQPPPWHKGHLKQRLESIVTQSVRNTLVPALDLEVQMGAKERAAIILRALDQYVVPYLDSLSTIDRIADYLNSEKPNFAGFTVALRELIRRRKDRA